ncbi:MAG: MarR family winged helix-turn-helix transcriptional regulator [Blastomonas sp.]
MNIAGGIIADVAEDVNDHCFKDTVAYKMQLLSRLLQSDYMARIASTGVAPAQAYVLGELWIEEPLSQVELARRLEIGKASTGKTLGRLEAAGLIDRRRNIEDRRVITVHLTDKGRAVRDQLQTAAADQDVSIHRLMGEDRLAQTIRLIDVMIAGFQGNSAE